MGDFICLAGEKENKCPGGRIPLNAGELTPMDIENPRPQNKRF